MDDIDVDIHNLVDAPENETNEDGNDQDQLQTSDNEQDENDDHEGNEFMKEYIESRADKSRQATYMNLKKRKFSNMQGPNADTFKKKQV